MYVAPPLSPEIYVFDLAEQKIVQKFGRSGRGPGEFERPFIKLKTIELMADPSNITFEKAPELPESAGSQMATADIGLDRTVPSHHIIYRLCMSDDYTVIFGTFDRVEGKPNFAVIHHESWDVTYHQLPYACLGMALDGGQLICLTFHEDESRRIQVLKVNRN